MADRGEIEPVEVAIFADTQAEPREVYEHLDWLEKQVRTPVVRVTAGNLRTVALTGRVSKKTGKIWAKGLPYWTRDANGKLGLLTRRQCTVDFKITPINRWIRKHVIPGRKPPSNPVVNRVFGISYDERERMRISSDSWATNSYPLVELRLDRAAVIRLAGKWFPGRVFPRSACTFCPFHSYAEWKRLRDEHPDEFLDAIRFDDAARALHSGAGSAMSSLVFFA